MQQKEKTRMQFEGIRTVLPHRDHFMLKSNKGIDKPSTLRSGWCSCIRRDSSRWSFFCPMMLPNISSCLNLKWCVGCWWRLSLAVFLWKNEWEYHRLVSYAVVKTHWKSGILPNTTDWNETFWRCHFGDIVLAMEFRSTLWLPNFLTYHGVNPAHLL